MLGLQIWRSGLAVVLHFATILAYLERSPAEAERLASELIELATRNNFALRIAKEQKSVSLAKRAEATYAEYRRQKASAS